MYQTFAFHNSLFKNSTYGIQTRIKTNHFRITFLSFVPTYVKVSLNFEIYKIIKIRDWNKPK